MNVRERDEIPVLMICTANMCRSPIAEAVMRDAIARAAIPWTVSSAGVIAQDGPAMIPRRRRSSPNARLRCTTGQSRRLMPEIDRARRPGADHRAGPSLDRGQAGCRRRSGGPFRYCSSRALPTMPTWPSRLNDPRSPIALSRPRSAASSIERIVAARENLQPAPAGSDDLADPIGQSIRHFRDCADTITRAVEQIVGAVTERSASRRR